jgi:hypothetical protein
MKKRSRACFFAGTSTKQAGTAATRQSERVAGVKERASSPNASYMIACVGVASHRQHARRRATTPS